MSVPTAKILIRFDDILVDAERRLFVSAKEEDCTAQNSEMNVIASSIGLFDDITASELMELNNDLAIGSELALENDTAKHIRSIIAGWTEFTSFDCEYYYRARALEENQAPYTVKNFGTAPEKYVGYGRYNHEGQCHYYVAGSPNGACSEIGKHDRKAILQVATLKPRKPAKLIDLSDKIEGNTFLKCLRFEADPKERVPRAYLLPCFVTTCCRKTQIEGIKYYGSKEYDNYVTWDKPYYDVIKVSEVPYEQDK